MSDFESTFDLITLIGGGLLCVVGFVLSKNLEEVFEQFCVGMLTLMGYWTLRLFCIRITFGEWEVTCIIIGFVDLVAIIFAGVHLFGLGDVS